ncbi:hypothetical protein AQUCO_00400466v1 [Aquilegia coerulea]|uniref:Prephenate/arogenate dehydrogenase domain-containing protein n=2 Tax=Aquilegia coerulea TaxID=218851 RepID=A0A2G5EV28_AQUCA|nr:hypothetical protein AQUCO_00400466v1 [Aquilegia coerulea]
MNETNDVFSSSTPLNIGIIGFGPFAQFLAKTMIKQGHILFATSRSDHSQLCSQLGVKFFKEMDPFLDSNNYDVILISTSILSLSQVLSSIPFHLLRQRTLFVDVLSVKEYPRQLLLQVLPEETDVLCTHPMFGPESGKNGWEGLAFMYEKVRIRNEDTCSRFLQIFRSEGCRMVEMPCEEHDRQAARSQFLTHTIGYWQKWILNPHPWIQRALRHLFICVTCRKTTLSRTASTCILDCFCIIGLLNKS